MTFEWIHYLDLAKELQETGRQLKTDEEFEATIRSCISRAYYAAFHVASFYLENRESSLLKKKGEGSHKEVYREFQNKGKINPRLNLIGRELENLCIARQRADYRIPYDYAWGKNEFRKKLTEEASRALLRSYKIIKLINSLSEKNSNIVK